MTEEELRAVFDAPDPLTVGLEEEVMLVDPASLDLAGVAAEILGDDDEHGLKLEMPASQLEVVTAPARELELREVEACQPARWRARSPS